MLLLSFTTVKNPVVGVVHTPVTPVPTGLRQEDLEFEARLGT